MWTTFAAAVLFVADWAPGLYFYSAGALRGLVWGVYGAWLFLTQTAADVYNNPVIGVR